MFTGIVEEIGVVERRTSGSVMRLTVRADRILEGTRIGDSISVNGVCLTVVAIDAHRVAFDVMRESQQVAHFETLQSGDRVNLERAMPAEGRFGGHIVSGHIDAVGTITAIGRDGESRWFEIAAPNGLLEYVVPKGSVAVDGVSLTVVKVTPTSFFVALIPHSWDATILGAKKIKDPVNLEADMMAKYIVRYLERHAATGRIDESYLKRLGFDE